MSCAFVALLLVSVPLAHEMVPNKSDWRIADHTAVRTAARIGLALLRFAAFYAALGSFRVAGLTVKEEPQVNEVDA